MKLTLFTLFCTMATATTSAEFERLSLPDPQDWSAGKRLFPGNVIAGYNADYHKYDKESWAAHVLEQCKGFEACTSSLSFSGM